MPAGLNLASAVLDEGLRRVEESGADPADTLALREPKRAWSYSRLHDEVCRAASALQGQGLLPGDRVLIFMHDGVEMAAVLLAVIRAGFCAVPLPDSLRPRELLDVVHDSGARVAVAHADLAEALAQLRGGAPELRQIYCLGGCRPGNIDFAARCFDADPHFAAVTPRADSPALLLYATSPEGRMRAHAYPHEVPVLACDALAAALGLSTGDRVFATGRLASTLGLGLNLLLPLRVGALSFLLPDKGRGRAVFDVLGSFRPTVFAATPTLYNQLVREFMDMSVPRPAYFRGVRLCLSVAEPLPAAVERRAHAVFQIELVHCFTAAEAFLVALCATGEDRRPAACGKPLPGLQARVHSDSGQVAKAAEIGHLQLRGAQLGGGLWCGVTRALLPQGPSWMTLPDRFFVDEDGYFFHAGRADGMFKVDGRLVSPAEVERVLLGHPAVWECVITEGEDEDGLPVPRAYVVLNVGRAPTVPLARELIDFVKRLLSPHKVPQAVEFVPQLPKGADGRVARWRLRSRPPLSPPRGLAALRVSDKDKG